MPKIITVAAILLSFLHSSAQITQLNPQGPAFSFTDAHLFNDQTLYLATGGPFLVRVNDLNDSVGWETNYNVVHTPGITLNKIEVLSKSIFAAGAHLTKDGGKTFSNARNYTDAEIHFKDGQDWTVISQSRKLFYSTDAGNTWVQAPGTDWYFWNPSQNSLMFYRNTDTTAWQFTNDSLYEIMNLREEYFGFSTYTWFHQLDNHRFAFEQQRRVFIYDTLADTLTFQGSHYFQAHATQVFINGNRIVRVEPAGQTQIAMAPLLNWQGRSPGYNAPPFAHSNGVSFYNSYLPFVPYSIGNLGYFKINGSHKQLLGGNKHPFTSQIYSTNDSSRFYSPAQIYGDNGKFFNGAGQEIGSDSVALGLSHVEFQKGHEGLAFDFTEAFKSNDNGVNWNAYKASSAYGGGGPFYSFHSLQYSLKGNCIWGAVTGNGFIEDVWVGREQSNGSFLTSQINTQLSGALYDKNQFLALNCDTAVQIIAGKAFITTSGPDNFVQAAWTNSLDIYSINYDGDKAIANTSNGFYNSSDLVNWTQVANAVMEAPIMAIVAKNNYFGLDEVYLHYSRDGGQTAKKVILPYAPLGSIAVVDDRDLLLGGENGQLYLFRNATTANVFVNEKEHEKPATTVVYFPNPAHNFFTLQWNEVSAGRLQLFNLSGEKVRELTFAPTNRLELNISDLKSGIYLVKIITAGKWHQVKLLVE